MRRDPRILLWLFPLAAGVVVVITDIWPRGQYAKEYGPNLAVDLLGIGLTVLVVDKILERHRAQDLARHEALAAAALKPTLQWLIHLLSEMCRTVQPGWTRPSTLDELLDSWTSLSPTLDFATTAPVTPPTIWYLHVCSWANRIESELLSNRDRNRDGFTTDTAEKIEAFLSSSVWMMFKQSASVATALRSGGARMEQPMLAMKTGATAEFAESVRGLLAAYETLAREVFPYSS